MNGTRELIDVRRLVVEEPAGRAFPLSCGLNLTDRAWNELCRRVPDTQESYYYLFSSLKILDWERSMQLKPSKPTQDEIRRILKEKEDDIGVLGDISMLFPGLVEQYLEEDDWRHFHYLFDKAVRYERIDESVEIAFNAKLISPARIEDGFLYAGGDFYQKALYYLDRREQYDKVYGYLSALGFFKFIYPGEVLPKMEEQDWDKMEEEITEPGGPDYLMWYLRTAKLGLADKVEQTAYGLKVQCLNNHRWNHWQEEERIPLPEARRF